MSSVYEASLTRRDLLTALSTGAAGIAIPGLVPSFAAAFGVKDYSLRAAPGRAKLGSGSHGTTPVWSYNGAVPGPEIRVRQGDRLRVTVTNDLAEPTTVHWHGVRLPNAMDGVPHLTQRPMEPGEVFVYEFDAIDAGTFWYHPHQRSFEQVGRGLYGPLIVEEPEPLRVDREVTWMLDDWRLDDDGRIVGDFGNRHDANHGGRIGNTVTINGRVPSTMEVRAGERIRVRLINASNARIYSLDFTGHEPVVVAIDGQPVSPHLPPDQRVTLGPAMRMDLVLDMTGRPGQRFDVIDDYYEGLEYRLVEFAYADSALRPRAPSWPLTLPSNPLSEPALADAPRHEITFNGGMMGEMVMRQMGGSMSPTGQQGANRSMAGMMHRAGAWFVNGVAADGHVLQPLLTLERGRSYVLVMTNATAWPHPIHLHGHSFRVISRDGAPTVHREWQDTVLMAPRERIEIAFVADNPGDWMFHCHILEHQAAGMMASIRVA